jgi:putative Mg2+ transporter-C (MgtC) family protein
MSNGDQLELVARLCLALGLGAAIGVEREFRGHEAGVRTTALVCLGAAMFGEISATFADSRVAAGVVQGIGFLGAGLIFQRSGGVSGVTTAAMIWVTAALGLLVAQDLWLTAIGVTVVVVVLLELSPLSDWLYSRRRQPAGVDPRDRPLEDQPVGDTRDRRDATPDR